RKVVLENDQTSQLDHRKMIKELIKKNPQGLSAKSMQKETKIPLRTIQLYLKELLEKKIVYKVRQGRSFIYLPG
ncbi:MAG: hypothetical protein AAF203_04965, partial [Pseudomonadota bacterium]